MCRMTWARNRDSGDLPHFPGAEMGVLNVSPISRLPEAVIHLPLLQNLT
jgi:hypothetical protein